MDEPTVAQRIRLHVYEHFLEHGRPPIAEELMRDFPLSREEVGATLRELQGQRNLAVVKGTLRILMAFPFSAIATPLRVRVRGRDYFANCAWDAVAFHAMLGEDDVDIDSYCHHCAQPIRRRPWPAAAPRRSRGRHQRSSSTPRAPAARTHGY